MTSPANPPSPLSLQLPGYTFVELIYQGNRTMVFRALETATGQSAVIKVLPREYPSFEELVRFRNQYTIAKNLPIAGIVRPLGLKPWKNSYGLVMEDFGGISLEEYIDRHPLALAEILDIAIELAAILSELHRHRVVHKDIKPANILIRPDSKQVKMIDFSIASLLPKETRELQSPGSLEGTLAYLAPEQTGRMNRGIDYRTDFYALGVTLYRLLAGELPFASTDPLELLHCHIARVPTALERVNREVPPAVGAIVAKLMAKNAENRYQSASGFKHDLERCRTQWQDRGKVAEFTLGERDWCDRFLIPEKLYGREKEVRSLLDAFERVSGGGASGESRLQILPSSPASSSSHVELMLVAGYSGIGKTALINEVHKPITRQHGYFIKGKFDQFNRNIPFSAFVQAFRSLMGQLLGESDRALVRWQTSLIEALGESGQVLIEVIPELERIIGARPPVPKLSGSAAQNRFNLLFGKLIRAIATREHPLVIFLDDLQWVDSASLKLLQHLMEDELDYLLVLGAYRDNEVCPAHPLMLTLKEIHQQKAVIKTLTLEPLRERDIDRLVADSLHCSVEIARSLSQLVYQKTRGNPFFATQFLQGLQVDGWISFIPPQSPLIKRGGRKGGYWQCDLTRVRQLALTDDVVAFMVGRLRKLPEKTQNALTIAACMGNRFDLETLAIVCEQDREEAAANLWRSLQVGLVIPENETYKFFQGEERELETMDEVLVHYRFLHDRVQQAAYTLIPENRKSLTHLNIGRLLLEKTANSQREEKIFEIVGHLNLGLELLMERFENTVLDRASSLLDKISVSETQLQAYAVKNEFIEGIHASLACLQLLGVDFLDDPKSEDSEAINAAKEGEKYIDSIAGFPILSEFALLTSLTHLAAAEVTTNDRKRKHFEMAQFWSDRLKIWADNAPMNYQHRADLVEAERQRILGDKLAAMELYDRAIAGAKDNEYIQDESLANELAAKFYLDWGLDCPRGSTEGSRSPNGKEKIAAVYMQEAYYGYLRWGAKAKVARLETRYPQLLHPILQPPAGAGEVLDALTAVTAPDISTHSSSSSSKIEQAFDFASILKASQTLAEIVELSELRRQLTCILWHNSGSDRCALILPDEKGAWRVEAIATAENVELDRDLLEGRNDLPVKLIQYVKNTKEILAIDNGKTDLLLSDPYLLQHPPQSLLCLPLLHQGQLAGILYASNSSIPGVFTRDRILVLNFLCTQAAISLENARLYQNLERRVEKRTSALRQSQQELTDYVENAAISLHWVDKTGTIIWANQMELDFLGYDREEYIGQPIAKFHADPEVIADILTRLANDETLVNYEARLRCKDGSIRYVQINSNVFYRDGEFIHTRCFTTDVTERKLVEREWRASQRRYAMLADMLPTGIFLTDPQGNSRYNNPSCCKMLGLTPAEASGEGWAKTLHPDDRERVFQGWYRAAQNRQMPYQTDCRFLHRNGNVVWLSVQAVEEFDLEGNLTGYIGSLTDITERKAAEAALNKLVEGTAATTGEDFFPALVRHISTALDVPIALITQFVGEELQSIAFMVDGELQPNFTYNLPETPCVELATEYSYYCSRGLSDRFPNNPHRERGVESYLGVALRDRQGQVLGSLCIFDRQPLRDPERARQILEIFASRTAAEMQRQRVETALHNLISGTAVTNGADFFPLLVRHLTEALGVSHALMAERVGDEEITLAYYGDGERIPCKSLSLLATPCEEVYDRGAYYCELEPCQTCSELAKMAAKSYLGVALYDRQGNTIGLLCIFHRQILSDPLHAEQILRVFAARAATELERQRAEIALQNLIAGTAALIGPDFFPGLVRHIAEALNASQASVTEVVEGDRLQLLAAWKDGKYLPTDTVALKGRICEIVLQRGAYYCDRDVADRFPHNTGLAAMGVESYMGVALQDRQGRKIGTLCILSHQPLPDPERSKQILRVFAARAAAELERQRAQTALEQLNRDLERRVEERTREIVRSERDLRTIFNNVYDGIFIHDLDGSILDVNNRALELFGATRGQILATPIADLSAPDSPPENLPELLKPAIAGAKLQFEWKHRRFDNSLFDSEVSARKVTLGNRSAIVVGVRDISDRKRAENALQEERLRLALALDAAKMGTWSCSVATGKLIWSERAQEIFGFEAGTFPGDRDTFIDMIHPNDRDRVLAAITATFETGAPYQIEYRIRRLDGEIRWLAVWGRTRPHLSSLDSQLVGVVVDISDRKVAEEKLRASKRRYATLTAAAPVGIFRTDALGNCLYVNERWCRIAGLTPEEAAGQGWRQGLHPEDRDRIAAEWYRAVQENCLIQLECRFQRPDGTVSWVYAQSVAERDTTGRVFGYVGTVVDITERRQAEERLKTLSERLELALEGAKIGIWEWNAASDRLIWDDRMFSLYGIAPEDFSGRGEDWRKRVHPDDLARAVQQEATSLRKRGVAATEYRIVRPHGEVRFIYANIIGQKNEAGELVKMIGLNVDITERKSIELALQTSERRYASLAATVPVGIFRTDTDGHCIYVNDRWCQMAGLASETAAREGWQQGLHPDDRDRIVAEWYRAARENCPFQLEYRFQHSDGTIVWVYGQAAAERDAEGQIIGYVGTLTDITDRKEAELALQDAQAQFRRMTENIPGTIYRHVVHADGRNEYTYVSSRIREMFELEPKAVLQNAACLRERIHPEDIARVDAAVRVFAETLQPFTSEYRLLLPQKGLRWVQAMSRPERLANGDTIWDGVVLDISDRKRSEQQLRGLSERLELAILSACIGIWEYDYQNDVLSWDEVMFAIYGVRSEDFGGTLKDWERCVHPEDLAEAKHVAENGEHRLTHEYRIRRPDGTIRHIFSTALVEWDEQKQLTRAIGTNIDISDRKQAEAQLQRSNQELARATRLKDEFLANMSHELRTPLTAILGMAEGLQEEVFGPANAMQQKALETIEQSGSHLLELIDDILDLSKIESGRVELEYSSVAIEHLCQSSLIFIKQQSQKKSIQLHLNVPANLPDITVDERRMRQVLINLLNNAVKFTPEGGQIALEVVPLPSGETRSQNTLRFAVTDTGIGIAPEDIKKLFQPFVQIDSALNRQYEGTGLGLALVKQIVDLHGGRATVTSEMGIGSCFAIELPYSTSVSLSPVLEDASATDLTAPVRSPVAPLILLAEDNDANIGTLSSYLQAKGYRLQVARNGQAAIDMARDRSPNLILMDVQMPGVDGLSAIERIRQDPDLARVPIIALTALTMEGDRERCLAAGANMYLSKPVKLKQLVLSIQKLLTNEVVTA